MLSKLKVFTASLRINNHEYKLTCLTEQLGETVNRVIVQLQMGIWCLVIQSCNCNIKQVEYEKPWSKDHSHVITNIQNKHKPNSPTIDSSAKVLQVLVHTVMTSHHQTYIGILITGLLLLFTRLICLHTCFSICTCFNCLCQAQCI